MAHIFLNLFTPEPDYNPSVLGKDRIDLRIPFHITFNLGDPIIAIGLNLLFTVIPIETMPEFRIAEDSDLLTDKSNVRLTRNRFYIFTIAKASGPQFFA